ncbi:MAG: hypothetical protein KF764_25100 [Labilithrix sp.]|nr:hypothetical protein [Labilithrix sp.]MBX3224198.1 hypothetical protein [Labilithrix sp.]
MAKDDPQTLCERLFTSFLGPLVVGGPMVPGKLFGGKNALAIGDHRQPSDVDLLSRCELARVRIARRLAPIDTLDPAPSGDEWALAACLHDMVQATHPGFDAVFRRSGPKRVLDVVEMTLAQVPPPVNVGAALSRHTWFSRMFDLARTDVDLRWWTGSETFLGTEPPKRLTAWPELRRVTETRTPRPLMELPTSGSAVPLTRFTAVTEAFLKKVPLTDLATVTRAAPAFAWTHENLSLAATHAGRTIVSRALAQLPQRAVDAALGRATRQLFATKAVRALFVAVDLLRDRALMAASARLTGGAARSGGPGAPGEPEPLAIGGEQTDAAFAIGAGALAASHWIAQTGGGFNEAERRAMLLVLAPAAESRAARDVKALLG